jgi:hypothetical protein
MFCLFLLASMVKLGPAAENLTCKEKLEQAEDYYFIGNMEEAITLAQQCLEAPDVNTDLRVQAYKIMARCYLAQEREELAKNTVSLILKMKPDFQPTIEEESPRFVKLVNETKIEFQKIRKTEQSAGINPWIWIGAGGVAVAAVIVLVATGSDDAQANNPSQTLPAPPVLP